ncbi:DUF3226 domain-containing protein [Candidatus Viridilinea mediisalina]|uniref:DUF4276 domain-containing protein n=1 Tax=Candidatus Viridilinea mediisalina TaxID=2024553 RepID=A0A2A6RHM7_9CHLR|nr:DUF3226 domain-containing protein [Candidatus Viridilinea mediisalina]PDW02350.1 hypothetical protein CJ255_14455 [Candidatus Viridilinea mediisalina]
MGRMMLLVEGSDDSNAVFHLLRRYGLPIAERRRSFPGRLTIEDGNGIERILESLPLRIQTMIGEEPQPRLGLVLDADSYPDWRWHALCDRLLRAGYQTTPSVPVADGTLLIEDGKPIIGIWMMPDNQLPGALEEFAQLLIPPNDHLWPRAIQAVQEIPLEDRRFGDNEMKAKMHTWLAWQAEPGKPIGQAITKHYLDPNAAVAQKFVAWVRRLFPMPVVE